MFRNWKLNTLFLSIVVTILLCCSSQARAAQEGDYTYTVTDGKAEITAYAGTGGDVEIPDTLGGATVTSIGNWSFNSWENLTSITIPQGVTSIGRSAFEGCTGLTSIINPEGVIGIGALAFSSCSGLTSFTIPESVNSIGQQAFECSGLTSITIPQNVTQIGYYAFNGCRSLNSIKFESATTIITDDVTTIPAANKDYRI